MPVEISERQFLSDALNIIGEAEKNGLTIRIIGALCGYLLNLRRDPGVEELYRTLGRLDGTSTLFTDLDLMAYSRERGKIMDLFEKKLGLKPDRYFNFAHAHNRLVYDKLQAFHIDLFFDKLAYSHNIDFGSKPATGRLQLDYPTISAADFVLEKLQIHDIARKDIVDMILLLKNHEVADRFEKEKIDGARIAEVLGDDWGFWNDATQNIQKIRNELSVLPSGVFSNFQTVTATLDKLASLIESSPKTSRWEVRARVGTNKPWYNEVFDA